MGKQNTEASSCVPAGRVLSEIPPGTLLGGYRVESRLGEGGMGAVYRATQLALGREVALKLLQPSLARDAAARQRFLQEGVLAARINHPRLVRVYEAGEDQGRLFLSCELIEGVTLRQRLDRARKLPADEAIAVADAVAEALEALHGEGILHRDVKPANIFLHPSRGALLGDFGIAKDVLGAGFRTQEGLIVGTPDYLAPEALDGAAPSVSHDLYALGMVLYECLSGRLPFDSDDALESLRRRAREDVPLLPRFEQVLERALAREPSGRFAGASGFRQALREVPAVRHATPTIVVSRKPLRPVAGTQALAVAPRRRLPWPVPAAFAAMLIGAAVLLRPEQPRPAPSAAVEQPRLAPVPRAEPPRPSELAIAALSEASKALAAHKARYMPAPREIALNRVLSELLNIWEPVLSAARRALQQEALAVAAGREDAARRCGLLAAELRDFGQSLRVQLSFLADWKMTYARDPDAPLATNTTELYLLKLRDALGKSVTALLADLPKPLLAAKHPLWAGGRACLIEIQWESLSGEAIGRARADLPRFVESSLTYCAGKPRLSRDEYVIARNTLHAVLGTGQYNEQRETVRRLARLFSGEQPERFVLHMFCRLIASWPAFHSEMRSVLGSSEAGAQREQLLEIQKELQTRWPHFATKPASNPLQPSETAPEVMQDAFSLYQSARDQAYSLAVDSRHE